MVALQSRTNNNARMRLKNIRIACRFYTVSYSMSIRKTELHKVYKAVYIYPDR